MLRGINYANRYERFLLQLLHFLDIVLFTLTMEQWMVLE